MDNQQRSFTKERRITMEKNIILDGQSTPFWLEDTGRLHNVKTGKWLKGGINKGAHFYSLFFKGKQYSLYTAHAVAKYFIPNPNPDVLTQVYHLDGNKLNDNYLNLKWVSPKENNALIKQNGQRGEDIRSKRGKIISLESYGKIAQFRDSPYYATEDGRILNLSSNTVMCQNLSGKYLRVHLAYGLNKKFLVHRVVWESFNGEIPDDMDVDHIDGNPQNNQLSNLRLLSHKDNIKARKMDYSYTVNNFNR